LPCGDDVLIVVQVEREKGTHSGPNRRLYSDGDASMHVLKADEPDS
jgi:hypothetical protein